MAVSPTLVLSQINRTLWL